MEVNGCRTLFAMNGADLSNVSSDAAYVSQAFHKTYVKVDEEGTEAAAATGLEAILAKDSVRGAPFEFKADHPFAYYIGTSEGLVLFAGVVNNPN